MSSQAGSNVLQFVISASDQASKEVKPVIELIDNIKKSANAAAKSGVELGTAFVQSLQPAIAVTAQLGASLVALPPIVGVIGQSFLNLFGTIFEGFRGVNEAIGFIRQNPALQSIFSEILADADKTVLELDGSLTDLLSSFQVIGGNLAKGAVSAMPEIRKEGSKTANLLGIDFGKVAIALKDLGLTGIPGFERLLDVGTTVAKTLGIDLETVGDQIKAALNSGLDTSIKSAVPMIGTLEKIQELSKKVGIDLSIFGTAFSRTIKSVDNASGSIALEVLKNQLGALNAENLFGSLVGFDLGEGILENSIPGFARLKAFIKSVADSIGLEFSAVTKVLGKALENIDYKALGRRIGASIASIDLSPLSEKIEKAIDVADVLGLKKKISELLERTSFPEIRLPFDEKSLNKAKKSITEFGKQFGIDFAKVGATIASGVNRFAKESGISEFLSSIAIEVKKFKLDDDLLKKIIPGYDKVKQFAAGLTQELGIQFSSLGRTISGAISRVIPGFEGIKKAGAETAKILGIRFSEIGPQFGVMLNLVDSALTKIVEKAEKIPKRIAGIAEGIGSITGGIAGFGEPLEVFGHLSAGVGAASEGVFRLTQEIGHFSQGFEAIRQLVSEGPFRMLIGQNVELQEQLLATRATLVATNKVLENGAEIKDPTQAITALTGPINAAIARLRETSLDLVGVTSKELVPVFQLVSGFASQIGINMSQASDLTATFAATMGTLQIPIFQSRQEISSILTQTIDMNSVLAKSLGITNEQVGIWKTQGKLFENLTARMAAFRAGNALAAQTINGVTSNIQEVIDEIARLAGEQLLQPVVEQLNTVYEYIKANKQEIADFVSGIVSSLLVGAQAAADAIGAVFQATQGTLAEILPYLADSLSNFLVAAAEAVQTFIPIVQPLITVITNLAGSVSAMGGPFLKMFLLAKTVQFGVTGLSTSFGTLATSLPIVGDLMFFLTGRMSPMVKTFLGLNSQVQMGAAGFLTLGKNLSLIPGAAGFISKQIPIFGTAIAAATPAVAGFLIQLVGINKAYPQLGRGLQVLAGQLLKLPGPLASLGPLIGLAKKIAPLVDNYLPGMGEKIEDVATRFTLLSTRTLAMEFATNKFNEATRKVGEQIGKTALKFGAIGAAMYVGLQVFDRYILKNEAFQQIVMATFKGLGSILTIVTESIAGVINGIGGLLGGLGSLIGVANSTTKSVKTAGETINDFLTSPVFLATAAIVGLVAAGEKIAGLAVILNQLQLVGLAKSVTDAGGAFATLKLLLTGQKDAAIEAGLANGLLVRSQLGVVAANQLGNQTLVQKLALEVKEIQMSLQRRAEQIKDAVMSGVTLVQAKLAEIGLTRANIVAMAQELAARAALTLQKGRDAVMTGVELVAATAKAIAANRLSLAAIYEEIAARTALLLAKAKDVVVTGVQMVAATVKAIAAGQINLATIWAQVTAVGALTIAKAKLAVTSGVALVKGMLAGAGATAAMGTASAGAATGVGALGIAVAGAIAPVAIFAGVLAGLAAIVATIGIGLYSLQLKDSNEATELLSEKTAGLSQNALQLQQRLKSAGAAQAEKTKNGIRLSEEEYATNKRLQTQALNEAKNLTDYIAQLKERQKEAVGEENKNNIGQQIKDIEARKKALEEQAASVQVAAKDLPRLGTAYEQYASQVNTALNAIRSPSGEADKYKEQAGKLIEGSQELLKAGMITGEQAIANLELLATNANLDKETQIKAQQAITEVMKQEADKRKEAVELQISKTQALVEGGKVSQIEGERAITEAKLAELETRVQAARDAKAKEDELRNKAFDDQAKALAADKAEAEAALAAASGDAEGYKAATERQVDALQERRDQIVPMLNSFYAEVEALKEKAKGSGPEAEIAQSKLADMEAQAKQLQVELGATDEKLKKVKSTNLTVASAPDEKAIALAKSNLDGVRAQEGQFLEQKAAAQKESDRKAELQVAKTNEEKAKLEREGQKQEYEQSLRSADELQKLDDAKLAQGQLNEAEYAQNALDNTNKRLDLEMAEIERQRSLLASTDKAGLQKLAAQEANIQTKRIAAQEKFQERQLAILDRAQKKALDLAAASAIERDTKTQELLNKNQITQEKADELRAESSQAQLKAQLNAEREYQANLEKLPKYSDPIKEEGRQAKIRDARMKTASTVKSILEGEERLQKAHTAMLQAEIEKVLQRQKNASEAYKLELEQRRNAESRVLDLQDAIVASMEFQNKILETRKSLEKALQDYAAGEYALAISLTSNAQKKAKLEEAAALARLQFLGRQQQLERQSVINELDKNDAMLEREKIQLRLDQLNQKSEIADKEVAVLERRADLAKTLADPKAKPEEVAAKQLGVKAAELALSNSRSKSDVLDYRGVVLDATGQRQAQERRSRLQELAYKQDLERDQARADYVGKTKSKADDELLRREVTAKAEAGVSAANAAARLPEGRVQTPTLKEFLQSRQAGNTGVSLEGGSSPGVPSRETSGKPLPQGGLTSPSLVPAAPTFNQSPPLGGAGVDGGVQQLSGLISQFLAMVNQGFQGLGTEVRTAATKIGDSAKLEATINQYFQDGKSGSGTNVKQEVLNAMYEVASGARRRQFVGS